MDDEPSKVLQFWQQRKKVIGIVIVVVILLIGAVYVQHSKDGFRPTRTDREADSSEVVAEVNALNAAIAAHFKQNPTATWR